LWCSSNCHSTFSAYQLHWVSEHVFLGPLSAFFHLFPWFLYFVFIPVFYVIAKYISNVFLISWFFYVFLNFFFRIIIEWNILDSVTPLQILLNKIKKFHPKSTGCFSIYICVPKSSYIFFSFNQKRVQVRKNEANKSKVQC